MVATPELMTKAISTAVLYHRNDVLAEADKLFTKRMEAHKGGPLAAEAGVKIAAAAVDDANVSRAVETRNAASRIARMFSRSKPTPSAEATDCACGGDGYREPEEEEEEEGGEEGERAGESAGDYGMPRAGDDAEHESMHKDTHMGQHDDTYGGEMQDTHMDEHKDGHEGKHDDTYGGMHKNQKGK